ncbi:hypothetical protein BVU17_05140 [Haloarcula taiwanensis]|uniref:Uncharacterized protein n=1 Tax=Haloarcula taiwanensis TaxID=1932004 RepID=A0A2H4ZWX1_9EURY|nr:MULTISPECIES: hypothetical protein [Haloarcula]AUG46937.1 hypothetical protein BVU17_05140 [Haloarcula taiwanensis]RLM37141.1 hypothetical protein DVK01_11100 [Haloarcula sp. Atlit-120R]RLM44469.1 hypothetical protein DVK00_08365 [Haloarcula sp. Atlit-47R]
MYRRRVLALCGLALTGAGCQGETADTETVTPVPSPAISETDTGPLPAVTITDSVVMPGVVVPGTDSINVQSADGQYLVLTVTVEGSGVDRAAFSLRFNGSTYSPQTFRNGLYRDGEWGQQFTEAGGPLVFDLPETGTASDARLSWPGGEWTPPETVQNRLKAPLPSFDVTLDGPGRVTEPAVPTLEITVTNTGDTAGRYVLALNRTGPRVAYTPVGRFDGELAPGETESITRDGKSPYVDETEPREVTYHLRASEDHNDATHRIKPVDEEATTES